ncbi:hypothetical protein ABIE76_004666 [Sinorhizobium fredii]
MIGMTCVWWLLTRLGELLFARRVAGRAGLVDLPEQGAELARIGLAKESVKLLDQRRNAGLFMHGLVRKRTELGAKRRNHPTGKVEVPPFRRAEVLLQGDDLLLCDEAVPATERLGVLARILVIGGHVPAHDGSRVARDVQSGPEAVLQTHAGNRFGGYAAPVAVALDQAGCFIEVSFIGHDFLRGCQCCVCEGIGALPRTLKRLQCRVVKLYKPIL